MVAAIVMVGVMLSSLVAAQKGFSMLDMARNVTTADQILQSELEDIRLFSWTKVGTLGASTQITLSDPQLASKYTVTRTVSDVRTDQKSIKITVSWKDYANRPHSRSYETLFTHFGLNDYFVTNRTSS